MNRIMRKLYCGDRLLWRLWSAFATAYYDFTGLAPVHKTFLYFMLICNWQGSVFGTIAPEKVKSFGAYTLERSLFFLCFVVVFFFLSYFQKRSILKYYIKYFGLGTSLSLLIYTKLLITWFIIVLFWLQHSVKTDPKIVQI